MFAIWFKYRDFPRCQTNLHFNRSFYIHLKPNKYYIVQVKRVARFPLSGSTKVWSAYLCVSSNIDSIRTPQSFLLPLLFIVFLQLSLPR